MRRLQSSRRGSAEVQWVVIATLITLALLGTWAVFGSRTSDQMDVVAEGVGDPTALTKQWGKSGSSGSGGGSGYGDGEVSGS